MQCVAAFFLPHQQLFSVFELKFSHILYALVLRPCYCFRDLTTKASLRLLLRVFLPRAGLPHGVFGCIPSLERPSPPPCGCAPGCMAVPRTVGLIPIKRLVPAFLRFLSLCSVLLIRPMVAKHVFLILRTSFEGSFTST